MARFLKVIGSGQIPCPEPYDRPYVDFSDRSNPAKRVSIGDELILYAAGGSKRIFAKATVESEVYGSGRERWPYRVDVSYQVNVLARDGVPIDEIAQARDLGVSVLRQSYLGLTDAEFDAAETLLYAADAGPHKKRSFTTYWKNKTWNEHALEIPGGDPLDHTASNNFRDRGVSAGDSVYVVTVKQGRLLVAGKMIVGQVCGRADAENILGTTNLWDAQDHLIASASTPIDWELEIPIDEVENLEFIGSAGARVPLVFKYPGYIDQQTLRGIRRLTSDSAGKLDQYLEPLKPLQSLWAPSTEREDFNALESFADGEKKSKFITYYERDRKNRAAAIRIHGYRCKGCDLLMDEKYGSHGKDFIHVHHIKPVSQFEMPKEIDPARDLTVLCPNCHAMVHKKRSATLSVEELRRIIQSVT
jgi:hypothetical protein